MTIPWTFGIAVAAVLMHSVQGYGSGAPTEQCDQMMPLHDASPQTGPSPYTLSLSKTTYGCQANEEISITLSGPSTFTGFLCQPRTNINTYVTSGTLTATRDVPVQNKCGPNASITHVSNEDKSSITFKWKPSANESVNIVCTVVQNYNVFWVKLSSPTISYSRSNCGSIAMPRKPKILQFFLNLLNYRNPFAAV